MQASQGQTWFQTILPQALGQKMSVGFSRVPASGRDQSVRSFTAPPLVLLPSWVTTALGGHPVQILGPGGQWHYFARLESFGEARVGQRIPVGFPVGTVGDSGNAKGTPPHLHYGTYSFFRQAEDPLPKLRGGSRMASRQVDSELSPKKHIQKILTDYCRSATF
jgi:hypothetical protein